MGQDKNCRLVKLQLVDKTGCLQDRVTSLCFDYNDLERNLGIFGKIESIYIKQHSVAFVQFEEQVSAVLALKSLQGFTLKEWKEARIEVKLCVVHNKQKNVREDFLAYPESQFFYSSDAFRADQSYAMLTVFTVDI